MKRLLTGFQMLSGRLQCIEIYEKSPPDRVVLAGFELFERRVGLYSVA
jgi:hypothetical protein